MTDATMLPEHAQPRRRPGRPPKQKALDTTPKAFADNQISLQSDCMADHPAGKATPSLDTWERLLALLERGVLALETGAATAKRQASSMEAIEDALDLITEQLDCLVGTAGAVLDQRVAPVLAGGAP